MKLVKTILLIALSANVSHAASLIYRNAVLANNPIAYYEFDETSGTDVIDTVAANNGAYFDSVTLGVVSGGPNLGTAVDFTGGFAALPDVVGLHNQFTIEAWIYADTLSGINAIVAQTWDNGAVHLNVTDELSGAGTLQAAHFSGADSHTNGGVIATGTWYHVVATADTTGSNYLYINGVLNTDATLTSSGAVGNWSNTLIGAWANNFNAHTPERFFDGKIDEVAFYDSALSAQDIAAHYAAATVPEPSSAALLGLGGLALILRRRK